MDQEPEVDVADVNTGVKVGLNVAKSSVTPVPLTAVSTDIVEVRGRLGSFIQLGVLPIGNKFPLGIRSPLVIKSPWGIKSPPLLG